MRRFRFRGNSEQHFFTGNLREFTRKRRRGFEGWGGVLKMGTSTLREGEFFRGVFLESLGMKSIRFLGTVAVLVFVFSMASSRAADLVRHVVCLKFKEGTKHDDIKKVEEAFRALKTKISDHVLALEWGTNVSKENRAKGFTHCFVLTFTDEKDVNAYIVHPDHKAFGALLGPVLDDVFVIDFHTKD